MARKFSFQFICILLRKKYKYLKKYECSEPFSNVTQKYFNNCECYCSCNCKCDCNCSCNCRFNCECNCHRMQGEDFELSGPQLRRGLQNCIWQLQWADEKILHYIKKSQSPVLLLDVYLKNYFENIHWFKKRKCCIWSSSLLFPFWNCRRNCEAIYRDRTFTLRD